MVFFEGLPVLHLDKDKMFKTYDLILGQIMRQAAREWLREVLKQGIPVETGMAKAALQPVGRILSVAVPISPKRKPYYSRLEGGRQDIALGQSKQDFLLIDDKSDPGSFDYSFTWTADVLHYWTDQFYNGSAVTGSQALIAGEQRFIEYINTTVRKRLPKIADFITFQTQVG